MYKVEEFETANWGKIITHLLDVGFVRVLAASEALAFAASPMYEPRCSRMMPWGISSNLVLFRVHDEPRGDPPDYIRGSRTSP